MKHLKVHGEDVGINFELHNTTSFDNIYTNIISDFDKEFIKILTNEEIETLLDLLIYEQTKRKHNG